MSHEHSVPGTLGLSDWHKADSKTAHISYYGRTAKETDVVLVRDWELRVGDRKVVVGRAIEVMTWRDYGDVYFEAAFMLPGQTSDEGAPIPGAQRSSRETLDDVKRQVDLMVPWLIQKVAP